VIAGVVISGIHNTAFADQPLGSLLTAGLDVQFLSAGLEVAEAKLNLARERTTQSQYISYFAGAILSSGFTQQAVLNGSYDHPLSFPLYATLKATRIDGVWGGEVSVAGYGTSARSPFTSQPTTSTDNKILIRLADIGGGRTLRPIISSFSYSQESA
jgi:hypothetical protein